MTVASPDAGGARPFLVQVLRGVLLTVLLLAGVGLLSYAADWPIGSGDRSGQVTFGWQPHWALLGVFGLICVGGLLVAKQRRLVATLRPTGVVTAAVVAGVVAAVVATAADRPADPVKPCRSLSACQVRASRAVDGRAVLVPGETTLTFTNGATFTYGNEVMMANFVDKAPQTPGTIWLSVSSLGPQGCNAPSGHPGITSAGYPFCLRIGRCAVQATMSANGLYYNFNPSYTGPCLPSYPELETARLRAFLDSMH